MTQLIKKLGQNAGLEWDGTQLWDGSQTWDGILNENYTDKKTGLGTTSLIDKKQTQMTTITDKKDVAPTIQANVQPIGLLLILTKLVT